MTITVNTIFTQANAMKKLAEQPVIEPEAQPSLKEVFKRELEKKGVYDESKFRWIDDETVEVTNVPALALHSFTLRAEEMGKDISYSKQTIIKITE